MTNSLGCGGIAFPVRRVLRDAGWSVVDQAMSALSNLVLSVMVARSVTASGFGAFAMAFAIYGIVVALTKTVAGQPLQIRFSPAVEEILDAATARAAGVALLSGLAFGLGCLACGLLVNGVLQIPLLLLAPILPGLVVQDTCRMAFFARGQSGRAALIDFGWAVVQFGVIGLLIVVDQTSLGTLLLAWGTGATVSALLGLGLLRATPRPRLAGRWLREQFSLTRYLVPEYVVGLGAFQVGLILVGVIASKSAVGALRAGQILLGPLGILGTATLQYAVPQVARRPHLSARHRMYVGLGISALQGAFTVCYVVAVFAIPDRFGLALFGDSWVGAAPVLLPLGLSSLASALALGPAVVLVGMGQAQKTLRVNVVKAPLMIFLLLSGSTIWGAEGAAWAMAVSEILVLPLWTATFLRVVARGPTINTDGVEPIA